MLPAILVGGFEVVKLLLKVGDISLQSIALTG